MQRTIPVKINIPAGFLDYMKTCSDIFNLYIDWSFESHSYNKNKVHIDLYEKFRNLYPNILPAIIQSIRDVALESVKALKFKFKPKKKPLSAIRYDKRAISLKGNCLVISWSGKRFKQQIKIPKYFEKYANWNFKGATICFDKKSKQMFAKLIFETETPTTKNSDKIVGIDRGLYNIVTLSNGFRYPANKIRAIKRKYLYLRSSIQSKASLPEVAREDAAAATRLKAELQALVG